MTDTQTKLLTVEDIRPVLLRIATENPDTVNPVNEFKRCLYTDPSHPDRHCIAGQFAVEMGFRVPVPTDGPAHSVAAAYDWSVAPEARFYLTRVQAAADGMDPNPNWPDNFISSGNGPRPWGSPEVIAAITGEVPA